MLLFITWFLNVSLHLDPSTGSWSSPDCIELVMLLWAFIDRQKLEEHMWTDKHLNQAFGAQIIKSVISSPNPDFFKYDAAPNAWLKCLSGHRCSSSFCLSMKAQRSITNSLRPSLLFEPAFGSKSKLIARNHVIKSNIRQANVINVMFALIINFIK